MELIHTVEWMKQLSAQSREEGGIVGLVPTGGGLHAGHLSLVEAAQRECSPVVISILQDTGGDDAEQPSGPRPLDADRRALEPLGVDYLFAPPAEEFYPPGFSTSVDVGEIADRLEGRAKPGELRRAAITALKLFEIVRPAFLYMGRKQAQKACILRRMARDLNLDTEVVVCPIAREPDGLAIGSRNLRLNEEERRAATLMHRALAAARNRIERGERMTEPLIEEMRRVLAVEPLAAVDYAEIVDADTFAPAVRVRGSCLAVVGAFIGATRLTDNMLIEEQNGRVTCTI